MPVCYRADYIQYRDRQFGEDGFTEGIVLTLFPDESILPQVVAEIVDGIFLSAPSLFELSQTIMAYIGSTET